MQLRAARYRPIDHPLRDGGRVDNPIARHYPYSFQTSLRYLDAPAVDHKWPGRAYRPSDTEVAQFEFMRRWDTLMQSNT